MACVRVLEEGPLLTEEQAEGLVVDVRAIPLQGARPLSPRVETPPPLRGPMIPLPPTDTADGLVDTTTL